MPQEWDNIAQAHYTRYLMAGAYTIYMCAPRLHIDLGLLVYSTLISKCDSPRTVEAPHEAK